MALGQAPSTARRSSGTRRKQFQSPGSHPELARPAACHQGRPSADLCLYKEEGGPKRATRGSGTRAEFKAFKSSVTSRDTGVCPKALGVEAPCDPACRCCPPPLPAPPPTCRTPPPGPCPLCPPPSHPRAQPTGCCQTSPSDPFTLSGVPGGIPRGGKRVPLADHVTPSPQSWHGSTPPPRYNPPPGFISNPTSSKKPSLVAALPEGPYAPVCG